MKAAVDSCVLQTEVQVVSVNGQTVSLSYSCLQQAPLHSLTMPDMVAYSCCDVRLRRGALRERAGEGASILTHPSDVSEGVPITTSNGCGRGMKDLRQLAPVL
eukprot:1145810-Pelagomonas_calceolata.AAC.5